ncbi:MAG: hypothetical protein H0V16_10155 [Burkholderiaceae bacterium]|nr:hypothetical protein [Burkholderiaceae bacterium]
MAADKALLDRLGALEAAVAELTAQRFGPMFASDKNFVAFSDALVDATGKSGALDHLIALMDRRRLSVLRGV